MVLRRYLHLCAAKDPCPGRGDKEGAIIITCYGLRNPLIQKSKFMGQRVIEKVIGSAIDEGRQGGVIYVSSFVGGSGSAVCTAFAAHTSSTVSLATIKP